MGMCSSAALACAGTLAGIGWPHYPHDEHLPAGGSAIRTAAGTRLSTKLVRKGTKRVSAVLVELGSSSPPVCLAAQKIREKGCDDRLLWDAFAEFAHRSSESIVPRRIDFSFREVLSSALHERHGLLVSA